MGRLGVSPGSPLSPALNQFAPSLQADCCSYVLQKTQNPIARSFNPPFQPSRSTTGLNDKRERESVPQPTWLTRVSPNLPGKCRRGFL